MVPTIPAQVEKKGAFTALVTKLFNQPTYTMVGDDIYMRDLASQSKYTPVAISNPQVPNIYESKVNMTPALITKTFGGSAKSVSMMSQVMHESH